MDMVDTMVDSMVDTWVDTIHMLDIVHTGGEGRGGLQRLMLSLRPSLKQRLIPIYWDTVDTMVDTLDTEDTMDTDWDMDTSMGGRGGLQRLMLSLRPSLKQRLI